MWPGRGRNYGYFGDGRPGSCLLDGPEAPVVAPFSPKSDGFLTREARNVVLEMKNLQANGRILISYQES